VSNLHGQARVTIGSTELVSISGRPTFSRNQARRAIADDGLLYQTAQLVMQESPTISFTTGDLAALFSALTGNLPYAQGVAQFVSPVNAAVGPGWAAAGAMRARLATAETHLQQLSWSSGGIVEAQCQSFGYAANGTTDPTTRDTIAAPTALSSQPAWVCTAATIGGTAVDLDGFVVTIDSRATNADPACFDAGKPFPIRVHSGGPLGSAVVSGNITTKDLTTAYAATAAGVDIVLTLTLKEDNIPGLTATQKTITLNNCHIDSDDSIDAGTGGTRSIAFTAHFDGTNAPFTAV